MKENANKTWAFGVVLMYLYILTSYIATDIYISTRVNSVFLYAFVGYTALLILFGDRGLTLTVSSGWYLGFTLLCLLTGLYAPEFQMLEGTFEEMLVTLCLVFCVQFYVRSPDDFRHLSWCYALASLGLTVILLASGNLTGDADHRLGQDVFGNANIFAHLMMVATLYALWLLVFGSKNIWQRLIALGIVAADMYCLSLSGGRKVFVVPLVFFYILMLFRSDRKGRRHILKYTVWCAVLALTVWIIIMNVPVFYESIGVRMESLVRKMLGGEGDGSANRRDLLRQIALQGWLERPLFGHGFNSFRFRSAQIVGSFYYSHCNYTELLYNSGVVGLVFYYWMFAVIFRRAWRYRKQAAEACMAFAVATAVSLMMFDYGAVSYSASGIILAVTLSGRLLSDRFLDAPAGL